MRNDIFSLNQSGAPSTDWQLIRFRKDVTLGAAFDGEEAIFQILDYRQSDDAGQENPAMMFVAAPRSLTGEGIARRYEYYRRAQTPASESGSKHLLIISAPAPLSKKNFVDRLLPRLMTPLPTARDDAAQHAVAALKRNSVSMLMVEGFDALMQCRHEERRDMLALCARIVADGGIPVVGICTPLNNSFLAAGVPFDRLQDCLNQPRKKIVFECLAAVTQGARGLKA